MGKKIGIDKKRILLNVSDADNSIRRNLDAVAQELGVNRSAALRVIAQEAAKKIENAKKTATGGTNSGNNNKIS